MKRGSRRKGRRKGGGTNEEGFSGTRGADEKGALWDLGAELGVLGRVLEEVDELEDLGLCLIQTSDVLEGRLALHLCGRELLSDVEHVLRVHRAQR